MKSKKEDLTTQIMKFLLPLDPQKHIKIGKTLRCPQAFLIVYAYMKMAFFEYVFGT